MAALRPSQVAIRVSPEEKELIVKAAQKYQLSVGRTGYATAEVATWARKILLEAARKVANEAE